MHAWCIVLIFYELSLSSSTHQVVRLLDVHVSIVSYGIDVLMTGELTVPKVRPGSAWRVEPQQGEIPPEETFEISLTANVDDVVRFQDKLQINFLESQSRTIPLEAYGFGTTIVTEPLVHLHQSDDNRSES